VGEIDAEKLIAELQHIGDLCYSPYEAWRERVRIAGNYLHWAYLKGRAESASLAREFNTKAIIDKIEAIAPKEPNP